MLLLILPVVVFFLILIMGLGQKTLSNIAIVACLSLDFGLLQTVVIKLTVINSNRPEYFVGMFYFLNTLGSLVFYDLYL